MEDSVRAAAPSRGSLRADRTRGKTLPITFSFFQEYNPCCFKKNSKKILTWLLRSQPFESNRKTMDGLMTPKTKIYWRKSNLDSLQRRFGLQNISLAC